MSFPNRGPGGATPGPLSIQSSKTEIELQGRDDQAKDHQNHNHQIVRAFFHMYHLHSPQWIAVKEFSVVMVNLGLQVGFTRVWIWSETGKP